MRHVAGDSLGVDAVGLEMVLHAFCLALGIDEHHDAGLAHFAYQSDQERQFVLVGRVENRLAHGVDRHFIGLDTNEFGFVHVLVRQLHDAERQCRRKQHVEALIGWRQPPQQIADVLDEAEIEHTISFIQHHHFDAVQLEHSLLEIVDDAARRADQDINAIFNNSALFFIISAAIRQADAETGVFSKLFGVLRDLYREFTGWRQHECARLLLAVVLWLCIQQTLKSRYQEGGGLAGTGLRLACDIVLPERDRQRPGLNRRAILEAGIANTCLHALVKRQCIESEVAQMVLRHGKETRKCAPKACNMAREAVKLA